MVGDAKYFCEMFTGNRVGCTACNINKPIFKVPTWIVCVFDFPGMRSMRDLLESKLEKIP